MGAAADADLDRDTGRGRLRSETVVGASDVHCESDCWYAQLSGHSHQLQGTCSERDFAQRTQTAHASDAAS